MNKLKLLIKPYYENETIEKVYFSYEIDYKKIEGFQYVNNGFNSRLEFSKIENLIIEDDIGLVEYNIGDAIYGPLNYKKMVFTRKIVGKLKYSYYLYPRVLPENYRSCPYYDFRNEEYGLTSSGLFSFIMPLSEERFLLNLEFDNLHCRDIKFDISIKNNEEYYISQVLFSYYIIGKFNRISNDKVSFYYLKDSEYFDITRVGGDIISIFSNMQDYFNDYESTFKIYIRRDPFIKSGGGTAAPYSFLSGYSSLGTTDLLTWKNVLIHEMTHTWIAMEESISSYPLTWFNEGMVEYISTFIPYKYGILSKEETLFNINNKAYERYYKNKFREFSEKEIEEVSWEDMDAQMIPYGRGFMYISLVEYQLRKHNKGSVSDLIRNHNRKNPLTESMWINFIKERLGDSSIKEYYEMLNGKLIVPPKDIFEGFELIEKEEMIDSKFSKIYYWKI